MVAVRSVNISVAASCSLTSVMINRLMSRLNEQVTLILDVFLPDVSVKRSLTKDALTALLCKRSFIADWTTATL